MRAELARIAAVLLGVLSVLGVGSLALAIAMRREPPAEVVTLPSVMVSSVDAAVIASSDAGTDGAIDAHVVYALDDVPRRPEIVSEGCPDVPLVDHEGMWRPALRVHPSFVPAVGALENAIRETAREVYDRDVAVMLSASSYRCTTVRRRPERISEHALGNAIDLRGIQLDDGTETSVGAHWHALGQPEEIHARFWRALVERIRDRGIFRGVLGPPAQDHTDHLHFDRGPSTFFQLVLDPTAR